MKPFRAPRKTGDKTQETVHRKDNSQRFKNVERWMDKNLTGKGRRVKSSEAKAFSPQKVTQTAQLQLSDSEEPTELGLVWPDEQPRNPWWSDEPCNGNDVIDKPSNGKDVMEEESPRLSDYESEGFLSRRCARNSDQKFSEGFKLLALARQRQQEEKALKIAKADLQAKDKILRIAQAKLAKAKLKRDKLRLEKDATSDDDDDNVPFSALLQQEAKSPSDDEDDNLPIVALVGVQKSPSDDEDDNFPIVALVGMQKLDVLAAVSSGAASIVYPRVKQL